MCFSSNALSPRMGVIAATNGAELPGWMIGGNRLAM